ncbi:FUSC family protein [Jeotgalibacillus soli]|uniref:Membrane protein n=1 Tax=Jeotgalibacillus soli TaxID=889306 RepID=A0A0C2VS35_9BACL|nr:aromatic acid exporter family protein [Jeotgalibacillus soli]KIL47256.1 membrane protein [Jeotgalibacillus soli]
MKLGARVLKTGIAIVLALFLSQLLQLPSPIFAGIAAVFVVQPTIYRSFVSILEHIQANLIGAAVAVLFVLLFGNHVVIIGLAAVITITIILKLRIESTIGLALVTLIAIMEVQNEDFITFALLRFATIMLGVFSSFIVNLIFLPPKYETKLFYKISTTTDDIVKWVRLSTRRATEHRLLKKDIEKFKERLIKIDQTYLMYKEERGYFKRNSVAKTRKLVVYRQMISSMRRSFEILKRLHRFENELNHVPESLQLIIQEQLDCLMSYHEQLLLRFVGKIKTTNENDQLNHTCMDHKEVTDIFMTEVNKARDEEGNNGYHLLHVLSAMLEYEEHLAHLDTLIASLQSYHHEENEVVIPEREID